MDPLPSVIKAYVMILLEKPRQVNLGLKDEYENSAMHVKTALMRKEMVHNSGDGGKPQLDVKPLYCDNCDKTGHTCETCFKLHHMKDADSWMKDSEPINCVGHGEAEYHSLVSKGSKQQNAYLSTKILPAPAFISGVQVRLGDTSSNANLRSLLEFLVLFNIPFDLVLV
ncbi:hypothetical protein Sango_2364600 [Sesamum angolense]|uniref:Uncharacterized protein n=1 Tax=Sesamum angolense TaxID=2727404 RepID=A0AAE1W690_9LAMI|nr:hypothetical protein Sango_2364600 [Sesamum angolense]